MIIADGPFQDPISNYLAKNVFDFDLANTRWQLQSVEVKIGMLGPIIRVDFDKSKNKLIAINFFFRNHS